jgi:hypothetical protein
VRRTLRRRALIGPIECPEHNCGEQQRRDIAQQVADMFRAGERLHSHDCPVNDA